MQEEEEMSNINPRVKKKTREQLIEENEKLKSMLLGLTKAIKETLPLFDELIGREKKTVDDVTTLENLASKTYQYIDQEEEKHSRKNAGRKPKDEYDSDIKEFLMTHPQKTAHQFFLDWYRAKRKETAAIGRTAFNTRVKIIETNLRKG